MDAQIARSTSQQHVANRLAFTIAESIEGVGRKDGVKLRIEN